MSILSIIVLYRLRNSFPSTDLDTIIGTENRDLKSQKMASFLLGERFQKRKGYTNIIILNLNKVHFSYDILKIIQGLQRERYKVDEMNE